MIRHIASAILFLLISPALQAQIRPTAAQSEVRDVLATFVQAFDNLDWETFRLAFSDDATVFYPRAFPQRANGRAEFEKTFRIVFDQIRDGKTQAPYTGIQPKDLKVQIFGNVAIATFLLDDRAGFLNRRTIVLNKTKEGWKIVHLHASRGSPCEAVIVGEAFVGDLPFVPSIGGVVGDTKFGPLGYINVA